MSHFLRFAPLLLFLTWGPAAASTPMVQHDLQVLLAPERGQIAALDTITLPEQRGGEWSFLLHEGLEVRVHEGEASLERIDARGHLALYRLRMEDAGPITLRYEGRIRHGLEELREGMGRARQWSRGSIEPDWVVLDGASGWYPRDPQALQGFRLVAHLPEGWSAVSQGAGPGIEATANGVRVTWEERQPQDDIYLIAARFERYRRDTPHGEAQVWLRGPDPDLAERYLDATERYLDLYSRLIGPYPYAKFALVENAWETGYGMPSFTLLGPRVIRLPFIVRTSYPHEILHNWWGNGVYVDYRTGNWSEGLTAYLADHLLKARSGQGADYRRDTLRSYADYVRDEGDFPLHEFRARHGSASQAIGYGKMLMLLHMLRRDLGDETFLGGLRRFYRDNLFETAAFDDLRRAFEAESGRDLRDFFRHWTERTGAPRLALRDVRAGSGGDGHRIKGRIVQVQDSPPYPLSVPLVVHTRDGGLVEETLALDGREARFDIPLSAPPVRLAADPRFEVFRRLEPGESPTTLSALFGAEGGLVVLPTAAADDLAAGWRPLAEEWVRGARGWEIVSDRELDRLPEDRPVWLLGWSNRHLDDLAAAAGAGTFTIDVHARTARLPGGAEVTAGDSLALVRSRADATPVGWVATGNTSALPGLARKLPHYGKYSWLVFSGTAPENRLKGQWPAGESALTVWLVGDRPELEVPPRPPLTAAIEGQR